MPDVALHIDPDSHVNFIKVRKQHKSNCPVCFLVVELGLVLMLFT